MKIAPAAAISHFEFSRLLCRRATKTEVLHTKKKMLKKEGISRCGPLSANVVAVALDVAAAAAACSCGRSVAVAACFWCSCRCCCWCHVVHQRNNFYCWSDRNFVVDKILIRFGLHLFARSLYAISI